MAPVNLVLQAIDFETFNNHFQHLHPGTLSREEGEAVYVLNTCEDYDNA